MSHLRDLAIIGEVPENASTVLTVGCGSGRIERDLADMGYRVTATDVERHPEFEEVPGLEWMQLDIRDPPETTADVVICSETLEHLEDPMGAFRALQRLATMRVVVTVPWRTSYNDPREPPLGHRWFWDDEESAAFRDVREFIDAGDGRLVVVDRTISKPEDVLSRQSSYLITVEL